MPRGISKTTGKPTWLGRKHTVETKSELTLIHVKERSNQTGDKSPNWKGGKFCVDCGVKIGRYKSLRCKPCSGLIRRRERNHNWRGGKTKERVIEMGRREYTLWRVAVFMRDDYICQSCLVRGGNLEADHIKPWSLYPELRYTIDNGKTLCKECHKKTDTYGYKLSNVRFEA